MEQPLRIGVLTVQGNFREHAAMLREGRFVVASVHPELTEDTRVHELFLDRVREGANVGA